MPTSTKSLRYYRELCDRSFYHFVKLIGGSVEQGGIISPYIHKPLCDFFQSGVSHRTAIFMPRNWLKSTVFTQWGALWLYCQNPNTRILIASQNDTIAGRFMYFIKRMAMTNDLLRKLYPDRFSYVDKEGNVKLMDRAYTKMEGVRL
jgi:hypothetical protein